ncbi:hypothetical protein SEA_ZAGIE_83 [Microbacterium phage Zagie]|nr:hypothetical protein SEA_ZAGIE_83 [Microbacterium phage Zagie]
MSDQPVDDRSTRVDQAPTLGEMAEVMRGWQARGVTLASVRYSLSRVYAGELAAEREAALEVARALRTEARAAVATTIDKHHPGL